MELDQVTKIASKYFAMGNIYINKTVDVIPLKHSLAISVIMLISVVIMFTWIDCPSKSVEIAQRALLGLSVAGIASPWFQHIRIGAQHLRGLAFVALFLIIYFITPSVTHLNRCDQLLAQGRIVLGSAPLTNAKVGAPDHAQADISNNSGEFSFRLDHRVLSDSARLYIRKGSLDTTLVFSSEELLNPLLISLPDTIETFTESIANKVLNGMIEDEQKKIEATIGGSVVEFEGRVAKLDEIIALFKTYEDIESHYRNEFEFVGLGDKINFRKNLIEAGIVEVDPLEPYAAHHMEDYKAFLVKHLDLGASGFYMEYALVNERPLEVKKIRKRQEDQTTYMVSAELNENVRAVRVSLEWSQETDMIKKRKMTFYGFLPEENVSMKFHKGKWKLNTEDT